MKTTPTALDIEAASLFTPGPGTLALFRIGIDAPGRWLRMAEDMVDSGLYSHPMAMDADDMATVGQMFAQVEAMRPGQAVSIVDRLRSLPGDDERRFAVLVEHDGAQTVATGPTRGAALVAAMRAFAGAAR